MPGKLSGYGVPESGFLAAGVQPIGSGMPDVVQLAPDVLAFTVNSFDERMIFVAPFTVTDTDTRQFPVRVKRNTPLRTEQTPVAR